MKARALLIVVLTVSTILAVHQPQPASAATGIFTIDIYPPVGSDTGAAHVNGGWHSGCYPPYADGTGVDWDDEDGSGTCCTTGRNVYWRSWTWITNTTFKAYIADVRVHRITSAQCYRTELYIRKGGVEANRAGTIFHDHADSPATDAYFWLHAASLGWYTGHYASTMIYPDKPGCSNSGTHAHEGHINGQNTWTKHVGAPPAWIQGADDCNPDPCPEFTYEDPALEPSVHSRHIAYSVTI